MLKLKRLFSDTNLFDPVVFHSGINIIQGVYTKSEEVRKKELNGIGKSTLIRLINYTLLSNTAKQKYFNANKYEFLKGHSVILEFEKNNGSFFIKREFDDPKTVSFGKSLDKLNRYNEKELKIIFSDLFFNDEKYEGYFDSASFRNLTKFFIKDDINNFERTDPLNFISAHRRKFEVYSYNLFLMNLPNNSLVVYDSLKKQVDYLKKQKNKVIGRLKDETGKSIEEISSEIRLLEEKIGTFQKSINEYKFGESYKDAENEIIKITSHVSDLLSKITLYQRKLNDYRKSYEYEIEIDQNKIVQQYSEVNTIFGKLVKKSIDDVISFRKGLAENRKRFLKKREDNLSKEIETLREKLADFEEKRSTLYKILDEKEALDSIKNTYSMLIEEKSKKERLSASILQVKEIENEIIKTNNKITESISSISNDIDLIQDRINSITSIYFDIVKESISLGDMKEVVFDIRSSPDMNSPVKIKIDVPKSDALGKSRYKILAYDLAVFLNIVQSHRSLPHFLIHDGVFHGIDIKTVIRVLNYMNSKFLQGNDMQYIITANENEIFIPKDKREIYGTYDFDIEKSIVATYKDIPEGMIFKREY